MLYILLDPQSCLYPSLNCLTENPSQKLLSKWLVPFDGVQLAGGGSKLSHCTASNH